MPDRTEHLGELVNEVDKRITEIIGRIVVVEKQQLELQKELTAYTEIRNAYIQEMAIHNRASTVPPPHDKAVGLSDVTTGNWRGYASKKGGSL